MQFLWLALHMEFTLHMTWQRPNRCSMRGPLLYHSSLVSLNAQHCLFACVSRCNTFPAIFCFTLGLSFGRAREDYVSDLANSIGVTTNHRRQRQIAPASGAPVYRRFRHGLRLRAADPRPPREDTHGWEARPRAVHKTHTTHYNTHSVPDNTTRVLSVRESPHSCARRALGRQLQSLL